MEKNNDRRLKCISEYFENLSNGNYNALIALFKDGATVNSPLYGKTKAVKFYKELLDDSDKKSSVKLLNAFVRGNNKNVGAGQFEYAWTLKNGKQSNFMGVDVFRFSNNKISEVTIIYDTYGTRENFNKLKENKK
jgi:hypothetical protein